MKKTKLFFFCVFISTLLFPFYFVFGETSSSNESHIITVGDYGAFSKAIGSSDDEVKIKNEPREMAMPHLTELDAMRFCNWVENGCLIKKDVGDQAMASTETGSYVLENNTFIAVVPEARFHVAQKSIDQNGNIIFVIRTNSGSTESLMASPLMMFGEEGKTPSESQKTDRECSGSDRKTDADSQKKNPQQIEIESVLFTSPTLLKGVQDVGPHYQNADLKWSEAEKAWTDRARTRAIAETESARLQGHRELLQQAKIIRERTDLTKTVLGRVSRYTEMCSGVLSFINTPFVTPSALLSAIGTTAGYANQYAHYRKYKAVKKEAQAVARISDAASEAYEAAKDKAPQLQRNAVEAEKEANKALQQSIIDLATKMRTPLNRTSQAAWSTWASNIVALTGLDASWVSKITTQGMNQPVWAKKITATLWLQRVQATEDFFNALEKEDGPERKKIRTLDEKFLEVKTVLDDLQSQIQQAKERLEVITEKRNADQKNLEKANQDLSALEESLKTPATHTTIESKKNELRRATEALEKSSQEWEQVNQQTMAALTVLQEQEKKATGDAALCFESYTQAAKLLARKVSRAKINVQANQIALNTFWPEAYQLEKPPSISEKLGNLGQAVQKGIEAVKARLDKTGGSTSQEQAATKSEKIKEAQELLAMADAVEKVRPEFDKAQTASKALSSSIRSYQVLNDNSDKKVVDAAKQNISKAAEDLCELIDHLVGALQQASSSRETPETKVFYNTAVVVRCLSKIANSKNAATAEAPSKAIVKAANIIDVETANTAGTPWEEAALWAADLAQTAVAAAETVSPAKEAAKPSNIIIRRTSMSSVGKISAEVSGPVTASALVIEKLPEQEIVAAVDNPVTAAEQKLIDQEISVLEKKEAHFQNEIIAEARTITTQMHRDLLHEEEKSMAREQKLSDEKLLLLKIEKLLLKLVCSLKNRPQSNTEPVPKSIEVLSRAFEQRSQALLNNNAILEIEKETREQAIEHVEESIASLEAVSMATAPQKQEGETEGGAPVTKTEEEAKIDNLDSKSISQKKEELAQREAEQKKLEEELRKTTLDLRERAVAQKEANIKALEEELAETKRELNKLKNIDLAQNQIPSALQADKPTSSTSHAQEPSGNHFYSKMLVHIAMEEEALAREKNVLLEMEQELEARTAALNKMKNLEEERRAVEQRKKELEAQAKALAEEEAALAKKTALDKERLAKIENLKKTISEYERAYEATRKWSDSRFWENINAGFSGGIESLKKAIKAEEEKLSTSWNWGAIAARKKSSAEAYLKAAEACAAEKKEEMESWRRAGVNFYHASEFLENKISESSWTISNYLETAADAAKVSAEHFTYSAKSYSAAKADAGMAWHHAGEKYNDALEKYKNRIRDYKNGNATVADSWADAATIDKRSAICYAKVAGACEAKKPNEIEKWRASAEKFHDAAVGLQHIIEEML